MPEQNPYSSLSIANYFLSKMEPKPSVLKLLKLMYFAHGWYFAEFKKPLVDELFEAWEFGPVLPSVYHEFKKFGKKPITDFATELSEDWENLVAIDQPTDEELTRFLDLMIALYGHYDGFELVEQTHIEGGPWDVTVKEEKKTNGFVPRNSDIPNKLIREFFEKLRGTANVSG